MKNISCIKEQKLKETKVMETTLYPYQNLSLLDMEGEIWKEYPGFEGYYMVSNKGRIKSLARTMYRRRNGNALLKERIIKQSVVKSKKTKLRKIINYQLHFAVCIDGSMYRIAVPRAVYNTFVKPLKSFKEKVYITHLDDDPFNNCPENLFALTPKELGKQNIRTGKAKVPDVSKFSEKLWKKIRKATSKPISQYSIDGTFVKSYESIAQASAHTQINATNIGAAVNRIYKHAGGYMWREGKSTKNIPAATFIPKTIRPVSQYSLKGDYINSFPTISEASKKLNILNSGISECINGNSKTCGGYMWRSGYAGKKIEPYKPQSRKVSQYDLEGNYIATYPSIIEAERRTKANKKGIYTVLKTKKGNSGGYFWKECDPYD